MAKEKIIESITINPTNFVIVYRKVSNVIYACNPPRKAPDTLEEETWKVINGQLECSHIRYGKMVDIPPSKEIVWE